MRALTFIAYCAYEYSTTAQHVYLIIMKYYRDIILHVL